MSSKYLDKAARPEKIVLQPIERFAEALSMGSIPAFHSQAAQDAADRKREAEIERDRANSFLDELDELLKSSTSDAAE